MQVAITYKTVTPEDRISRVVSGDTDLECGSTTRNRERAEEVAFSPVFFVAGTKLMVPGPTDPVVSRSCRQDRGSDRRHHE